jgi:hypothetical protein
MMHKQLQRRIEKWVAKQTSGGVLDDGDLPDAGSLKAAVTSSLHESNLSLHTAAVCLDSNGGDNCSPVASTATASVAGASTIEPMSKMKRVSAPLSAY